jgi:hypothetical protein
MNLDILINDYNGSVLLEPGTAEWGYVEPIWYLQLPVDHTKLPLHKIGSSSYSEILTPKQFIMANYNTLKDAKALNNPDKALFGALLRHHCAMNGFIESDLDARCVIENEYATFVPANGNWNLIDIQIPENPNAKNIASFVKKYADTFIQMLVYVFSSRGHHWQEEFDALYDKLMQACGVVKPNTWQMPTNRELFRQILHCFGIAIPLAFSQLCLRSNRMCNPLRLRFTPHCPVAGAAKITTLNAVLLEMKNEAWYSAFAERFGTDIAIIDKEVKTILVNPYAYHVSSRVLTGNPKLDLSIASENAFKTLCQVALGYIDHLGRRHSLSNQKVITLKSGGIKPVAEAFSKACDKFGKPSTDVDTMRQFLTSL